MIKNDEKMVKTEKMITRNIKSKLFLRQQKKTKKNAKSSKKILFSILSHSY